MKAKMHRPRWFVLGLAVVLLIALLVFEHGLSLPTVGRRVVQVAMVLLFYALVALWLKANEGAIMMEDWEKSRSYLAECDRGPDPVDQVAIDAGDHAPVTGTADRDRMAPGTPLSTRAEVMSPADRELVKRSAPPRIAP